MSKKQTSRKKGLLAESYENSLIISTLDSASASLRKRVGSNAFVRFFAGKNRLENHKKSSVITRLLNYLGISQLFLKTKTAFARLVESSSIVSAYRRITDELLCTRVRDYGIFLLFFSLLAFASSMFKIYSFDSYGGLSNSDIIAMAATLISSVFLLMSKKSVAQKLEKSVIFSFVFLDILGISPLALHTKRKTKAYTAAALAIGTILGTLTFLFTPTDIIKFLITVIFSATVLYSPESGLLLSILLLPFLRYEFFRVLVIIAAISYVLKLFRGKRNISFSPADIFVLLFALASWFALGTATSGTLITACCIYLLIVNLFRNQDLLEKGVSSLGIGLGIYSLINAFLLALELFGADLSTLSFVAIEFSDSQTALLSLISVPFSLIMLQNSKSRFMSVASLLFFFSALINVALSYSMPVWCYYLGCLVIYAVIRRARLLSTLMFALLSLPFIVLGLTKLAMYGNVTQFDLPALFKYDYTLVKFFGGGTFENSDSLLTSIASCGGIALIGVLLIAVIALISRAISSINGSRLSNVRIVCGGLIVALIAGFCVFTFPETSGSHTAIFAHFATAGLISASGNVYSRYRIEEEYQ